MKKLTFKLIPLIALTILSSCGTMPIARLLHNPARFENRTVNVSGVVSTSFGVPLVGGLYQVQDESGKIYVLSSRGSVPTKGARVKVSGLLNSGVTVAGRAYGTVIREERVHIH
ncbi:MAG: hypothetical protein ABI693_22190 [Bryobacteraceae bacterium]